MGPADMPAEHRVMMNANQLAERKATEIAFYKELLAPKVIGSSKNNNMKDINDIGQVRHLELADRWTAGSTEAGNVGNSSYREFKATGKSDVKFCFYYRGTRMSDPAAKAFHEVLASPPHALKPAELKSLSELLAAKADPAVFSTLSARTEDLNGKRVLMIEGRYKEKQFDTTAMFIDSDGSGSAVQEVFYQAPKADYVSYLKDAKDAFRSIQWK